MGWNVISCAQWRLYVIIDGAVVGRRDPAEVAAAAIRGGADVIQLRDKAASTRQVLECAQQLLTVTRAGGVPLLINDRVDVAVAAGADGVHVGQDDLPVWAVRRLLGPERIVGKSTHSLEQALAAEQEGVDYLALGPLYPTPTKPDSPAVGLSLLGRVRAGVTKPLVAIGGIDETTVSEVLGAGAACVAVVRAVCAAADPQAAAQHLKRLLVSSFH
ncbi:MAG: thiamine phosphate synthase [Candidatus Omnitrophota bacterium]|nr:thiamine phosphate synthase [Candidatus Omnitrophota bacterium]